MKSHVYMARKFQDELLSHEMTTSLETCFRTVTSSFFFSFSIRKSQMNGRKLFSLEDVSSRNWTRCQRSVSNTFRSSAKSNVGTHRQRKHRFLWVKWLGAIVKSRNLYSVQKQSEEVFGIWDQNTLLIKRGNGQHKYNRNK